MTTTTTIQKERPILFFAPMVLAILEGRKTMTRRIAKQFNPPEFNACAVHCIAPGEFIGWDGPYPPNPGFTKKVYRQGDGIVCPYGRPGDRLWVRETWAMDYLGEGYIYRADLEGTPMLGTWKPSIFMPRAASRILLEITDVQVERLWDISEEDAAAEGVKKAFGPNWVNYVENNYTCESAATSFLSLFASINGRESLSENPWVWVITFKRIEP